MYQRGSSPTTISGSWIFYIISPGERGDYCNIFLWRKVVCFVVMRSTKLGCFRMCSWCVWEALDKEGCMGFLVPWCLDLRCNSSWILKKFLHWKLNWIGAENFGGIGLCLWCCCWKDSWWAGFNQIYLVRFGFRMWEILILKSFNCQLVYSLGSNVGLTWQLGKPARGLGNTLLCRDWGLGESRARGHAGSWVSIKGTPVYYVVEERLELWESE